MSHKVFNLTSVFKAKPSEDGSVKISGLASTTEIDRAGDVIAAEAWQKGGLENFKRNPIILFNHNYNEPIGRATMIRAIDNGLELEAKISKAAGKVVELIKDGVLGAFSVGFLVKDAEYIEETDGFKIKDAELFEVSVVSIPANQSATFSLAKSFNSMEEYEEFKKTFTNRVDLAGQLLAEKEANASNLAGNTSEGASEDAHMEINMSGENTPKVDLKALANEAAESVAAKMAMQEAQRKAAEEKAAQEKAEKEAADEARRKEFTTIVETGTEKLVKDMEARFKSQEEDFSKVIAEFRTELESKAEELKRMRESKRVFTDRGNGNPMEALRKNSSEAVQAHLLGVITGKGWNTELGREVLEKAGLDYTTDTNTGDLDQEVRDMIQKEVWYETKVASLFREIEVNGRATVLPLQTDTNLAAWAINAPTGNLENRTNATANTYKARSVTMTVDRLVSSTYIDNDVDEKTLVNLMPMLTQGVARAHARRVEAAIMYPSAHGGVVSHVDDLEAAAAASGVTVSIASPGVATAADLIRGRAAMGKYGLTPSDIAYIVSPQAYYDLIADPEFQNLNEVGEIASKLRGVVGGIFGSPVVVSEEFPAQAAGEPFAYIVNRNNYLIPRLRGIRVEQDYEVANQRRMIVASQSLGFTELFAGATGNEPVVTVSWAT